LKKNANTLFSLNSKIVKVDTSHFYATRDVAHALGITEKTYVANEKKGIFPKAKRDPVSRYRVFTQDDIEELQHIYQERIRERKIQSKHWKLKGEADVRQKDGKLTARDACVALGICERTYVSLERRGILPEAPRDETGKRVFDSRRLAGQKKRYGRYVRGLRPGRTRDRQAGDTEAEATRQRECPG